MDWPRSVAVLIDGGHLRAVARKAGVMYGTPLIEKFAKSCVIKGAEEAFRYLYYDCPPFSGSITQPVSKEKKRLQQGDMDLLRELAKLSHFAVRQGTMKFRGWELNTGSAQLNEPPKDSD